MLPTLTRGPLTLRPATSADAHALTGMLEEPAVARWWGDTPLADVLEHVRRHPSWIIEHDSAFAGWLHVHEEDDPRYPSVWFDIALRSRHHGRGLGRAALRLAIAHFIARGHHRFAIDPASDNEAAIHCYAAVGFKPVGVMRAYELLPDGRTRDGLLMDLLGDELR